MNKKIDTNFAIAILVLISACIGFSFWFLNVNNNLSNHSSNQIIESKGVSISKEEVEKVMSDEVSTVKESSQELAKEWRQFKDEKTGLTFSYPARMEIGYFEDDSENPVNQGHHTEVRIFSNVDEVDRFNMRFSFYSEDFARGAGEGCCFDYAGKPIDISQVNYDILNTLSPYIEFYDAKQYLFGPKRVEVGGREALSYYDISIYVASWVTNRVVLPFDQDPFSNLLIVGPQLAITDPNFDEGDFESIKEKFNRENGELEERIKSGEYRKEDEELFWEIVDSIRLETPITQKEKKEFVSSKGFSLEIPDNWLCEEIIQDGAPDPEAFNTTISCRQDDYGIGLPPQFQIVNYEYYTQSNFRDFPSFQRYNFKEEYKTKKEELYSYVNIDHSQDEKSRHGDQFKQVMQIYRYGDHFFTRSYMFDKKFDERDSLNEKLIKEIFDSFSVE